MKRHRYGHTGFGNCLYLENGTSCLRRKYDPIHHEYDQLIEEPIFILRGQDVSASALIQLWITLNKSAPAEKLSSAQDILERFRAWPLKKHAD